jgi:YD repeat-containing protein
VPYAYDNANRMTTVTLPSAVDIVSTYSYDNAGRLTGITHIQGGSTTIDSVAYTLDNVGNHPGAAPALLPQYGTFGTPGRGVGRDPLPMLRSRWQRPWSGERDFRDTS